MHSAALHLAPVLAAEKSKVPFYIAGGTLVAWALIVSVGLGMRRPSFPGGLAGQRIVMAISGALVLAAVSTAVITAGTPAKAGTSTTSTQTSTPAGAPAAPAPTSSSTPASSTASTAAPAPAAAASALTLSAVPNQLAYDTKQLSAKAGKVTITFTNTSPLEHDVTIALGSTVLGATPKFTGGSKSLTLTLKPGTYTFYCSVPGHRQAGMEGTLSVS